MLLKRIIPIYLFCFVCFFSADGQSGDSCKVAIVITPGQYTVDTIIGKSGTHPVGSYGTKAKWYSFTPSQAGLMSITSCMQGSDTRLFLHTGKCDSLVEAGYNDDDCLFSAQSKELLAAGIQKPVNANQTYFIEWDNLWDSTRFSFTLSLNTFTPRSLQTCQTALSVNPGIVQVDSLIGFASRGDAGKSNWYKFTPVKSGRLSVNSCGGGVDTRLWVYKGACGGLTLVANSDDDCQINPADKDSLASAVTNLDVVANTIYYLEWDDANDYLPFSFSVIFDALSGVEEARLDQAVKLYPNPASDYVRLDYSFGVSTNLRVRVLNSLGQAVFTDQIRDAQLGTYSLDVRGLGAGFYWVELWDGVARTAKKLVIE